METFSNRKTSISGSTLSISSVNSENTRSEINTVEPESVIKSTETESIIKSIETESIIKSTETESIIQLTDAIDLYEKETTESHIDNDFIIGANERNLSKENDRISIEEDIISQKRSFIINEVLSKEESEERINMMLLLATLPLILILLGFITKILLIILPTESEPLIFKRLENIESKYARTQD